MRVRPLEVEDLPAAAAVSGAAFGVDFSQPAGRARWLERVGHAHDTDPDGCFVAEADGRIAGVAQVIVRDALRILSLLAVDPSAQSTGAGRALMERALTAMGDADPALVVSSNHPGALRLYALAGFRLLPTFQAEGRFAARASPPRPPRSAMTPSRTLRRWRACRARCGVPSTRPSCATPCAEAGAS